MLELDKATFYYLENLRAKKCSEPKDWQNRFTCPHCGQIFDRRIDIRWHREIYHQRIRELVASRSRDIDPIAYKRVLKEKEFLEQIMWKERLTTKDKSYLQVLNKRYTINIYTSEAILLKTFCPPDLTLPDFIRQIVSLQNIKQ